jgi:hypothetical protein
MSRKCDTKLRQEMWHKIMTRKGDLVYITQKWVTYRDTDVSKNGSSSTKSVSTLK